MIGRTKEAEKEGVRKTRTEMTGDVFGPVPIGGVLAAKPEIARTKENTLTRAIM